MLVCFRNWHYSVNMLLMNRLYLKPDTNVNQRSKCPFQLVNLPAVNAIGKSDWNMIYSMYISEYPTAEFCDRGTAKCLTVDHMSNIWHLFSNNHVKGRVLSINYTCDKNRWNGLTNVRNNEICSRSCRLKDLIDSLMFSSLKCDV